MSRRKDNGIVRKKDLESEQVKSLLNEFERRIKIDDFGDKSLEELKGDIVDFIKIIFKEGDLRDKLFVFREVMKYLFPTKREVKSRIEKKEIIINVHKDIIGDYVGDNISKDGVKSDGGTVTDAEVISSE